MDDRRKYKRFPIELSAKYHIGGNGKWKGCTVTNISRNGMGIIVYLQEKLPLDSYLQLEIMFPSKEKKVRAIGILKWLTEVKEEKSYMSGVEFVEIDPEDKWELLDYAFDEWSKKREDNR
jgi:c-di-GMP-binding flagellar brake protein YcgR